MMTQRKVLFDGYLMDRSTIRPARGCNALYYEALRKIVLFDGYLMRGKI
jgi:hypothetical protein